MPTLLRKIFAKTGFFLQNYPCFDLFDRRCSEMKSWLQFDFDDLDSGYVYCCSVADALRTIKVESKAAKCNLFCPVNASGAWQQGVVDRNIWGNISRFWQWWNITRSGKSISYSIDLTGNHLVVVGHIVDDMLVSSLLTPRRHHCYWEHLDLYSLFCFLVKIDFIDLTFRCILTLVIVSWVAFFKEKIQREARACL